MSGCGEPPQESKPEWKVCAQFHFKVNDQVDGGAGPPQLLARYKFETSAWCVLDSSAQTLRRTGTPIVVPRLRTRATPPSVRGSTRCVPAFAEQRKPRHCDRSHRNFAM
ncbi:hypothetical protein [Lysobacter gummosus]|uniref:hypothetical protein n=1 Tax=Lysobacter gummosus TaxID=262324 RepID=UPI00362A6819